MEEPSQSTQPQLCRNGCGFYGSAQTEGMCSKCYKEKVQKSNNSGKNSPPGHNILPAKTEMATSNVANECSTSNDIKSLSPSESRSTILSSAASSTTSATSIATNNLSLNTSSVLPSTGSSTQENAPMGAASTFSPAGTDQSPSKPKKSRCATCRKRVGLTGFSCRCGKIFCGIHRYSDEHNCDYDYKANAQANLRKENPVVVGEKIQKI